MCIVLEQSTGSVIGGLFVCSNFLRSGGWVSSRWVCLGGWGGAARAGSEDEEENSLGSSLY